MILNPFLIVFVYHGQETNLVLSNYGGLQMAWLGNILRRFRFIGGTRIEIITQARDASETSGEILENYLYSSKLFMDFVKTPTDRECTEDELETAIRVIEKYYRRAAVFPTEVLIIVTNESGMACGKKLAEKLQLPPITDYAFKPGDALFLLTKENETRVVRNLASLPSEIVPISDKFFGDED